MTPIYSELNSILEQYISTRKNTVSICEPLSVEDHLSQPIVDVSPPKWHLAHTTWFFETFVLRNRLDDYKLFDSTFPFLFNSYYENEGKRLERNKRGNLSRPSVAEVYEYRSYVDKHMQTLFSKELDQDVLDLIILGLNHEEQHQELLLTDIKYGLYEQVFHPIYNSNFTEFTDLSINSSMIEFKAQIAEIGYKGDGFCFDNELSRHKTYLQDFKISKEVVSNAEWLEFIESGAYSDFKYWHSDGWEWVKANNISMPLYWEFDGKDYFRFGLSGLKKLNLNEPISHISYYEAAAYAEFRGKRLPTEFEWEFASSKLNWGQVWEWTNSAYLAYPNFSKADGAVGEYNAKFMVNQMVLRGASIATAKGHSRPSYRNFFQANLRWQFTGLRLAE